MAVDQDKYLKLSGQEFEKRDLEPGTPGAGILVSTKTKWKDDFVDLAFKYSLLGASLLQIAEFMNISIATLHRWRDEKEGFGQALLDGREVADAEVAHALFKRATGFKSEETKVNVVEGEVVETVIPKEIPADVNAAKYWLGNRSRKLWQSTPDVELNANINVYKPIVKRFDGSDDSEENDS